MIYVYAAGYGSTGPHSHRPAMHPISEAVRDGALAQLGRDTLHPPDQVQTFEEVRDRHDAALAEELERVFAVKEPLQGEALLTAADVACVKAEDRGPFHFYDEDAHVKENGFTTQVDTQRLGTFWRYSPLLRFSYTKAKAQPGMLKGQHTEAILRELGYSLEQRSGRVKDVAGAGGSVGGAMFRPIPLLTWPVPG